jgi:alkylation response protein AidB-like acyl-CoA dehydrogenase
MSIAISPDHVALADSVRALVRRTVSSEYLHAELNAKTPSNTAPYWGPAADMGLFGLHIPADVGGQGFGYAELVVAIEELARAVAPGSFVPTVLASAAIASALDDQLRKDVLPGLAGGSRRGCVALAADPTGTYVGDALSVSGTAAAVLGASDADLLVLPVSVEGAAHWVAIDRELVSITTLDSVDVLRPVADVTIDAATGENVRLLEGVDTARVRALAGALFAAEASGIAAATTKMASDYAKVREQFGRPIGQFQAVKHKCANMLVESERAAATAWNAARMLDDASCEHTELVAAVAASLSSTAALHCAQDAIQVLGGIGFTWEHDVHLYYRRALGIAAALGRNSSWTAEVARLALECGLPKTQIDMPEGTDELRAQLCARSPNSPR